MEVMNHNHTNISEIYAASELSQALAITLFSSKVEAGFPSPADDTKERKLDLNQYIIQNPSATFFVRATGDSMIGAGIQSGDLLVVDRSLTPSSNKIIIAVLNGEMTVKRLIINAKGTLLQAENPAFSPIPILPSMDFHVWGVVTTVIHKV